jgi:hypothetical protein
MMIKLNPRLLGILLLAFLTIVLAGCGAAVDVTVDFYRGENWQAVTEISFPVEALAMAGGAGEIEKQLDELVAAAAADDVRVSWEKTKAEGNLIYTIKMKGKGLDTLSRTVFDGEAEIYVDESSGRRLIHFGQYMSSGWGFSAQTLTLKGGEIIAGNGQLVDDRTITWENPSGRIEATLTERSRLGLGGILGIVGVVAVAALALGGVQWWQRSRVLPPVPCPWCGSWIPEGARYCPGCGRPR